MVDGHTNRDRSKKQVPFIAFLSKVFETVLFQADLVKRLGGHQFTLSYIQENGFNQPIHVLDSFSLDLKVS